MKSAFLYVFLAVFVISPISTIYAQSSLLTKEENIWLSSRNNTISVLPEKNNPPFSFNDSSYITQGIFIDYIKLVAEKLDLKIDYITARTRSDVLKSLTSSEGDYVSSIEVDKAKELSLDFSDPYSTFPVVIAVRKDYSSHDGMTLDEFNNKSVAVIQGSAISSYIKSNYPRVIVEEVVDNELALQKVALDEVDATVMNVASLTHLLSKQSMRSIKVAGSITFDLKMAFAVPEGKAILSSILNKGLKQVTAREHQDIIDKWILLPNEKHTASSFFSGIAHHPGLTIVIVILVIIVSTVLIFIRRKMPHIHNHRKEIGTNMISELEQEIIELEHTSEGLIEELNEVKALEQDIKDKLKN